MADFSVPFPPEEWLDGTARCQFWNNRPGLRRGGGGALPAGPRVILSADVVFKCQVAADRILPVPLAANYMLTIEAKPKELGFRRNGVSSGWFDANQR